MSRRTLSHFLNRDSDKKKKVSLQALFRTFLRRGSGKKNCAASPRLRFSFFRFSPCSRMGVSGLCRASGARSRDARNAEAKPSQREKFARDLPACAYPRFQYTYFAPSSYAYPPFRYTSATGFFPRTKKKRSRGKIRRKRFMKPKRKRLKRRAVRRERLREPALLPLREQRLLSPFWL